MSHVAIVRAIRVKDLRAFTNLEPGARCAVCGVELGEGNVGGFVVRSAASVTFCDDPECLAAVRMQPARIES